MNMPRLPLSQADQDDEILQDIDPQTLRLWSAHKRGR